MSVNQQDGKKWVQALIVGFSAAIAYISLAFIREVNGLWDLEAKIGHFSIVANVLAVLVGLITFVVIMKNKKSSTFLNDVWTEFRKVVFPEIDITWRHTFGIMVGVGIVGFLLWLIDISSGWTLAQLY